ncbi:MAG: hypothetical protein FJW80_08985 [Actinobacteria bacterium]|nr:hypothetical protein [Actinomycetota bacterium]
MAGVTTAPGLSAREAADRLARDGPHEPPAERPRGLLRLTWSVLREPMILLLAAFAMLVLLIGVPLVRDALVLAALTLLEWARARSGSRAWRSSGGAGAGEPEQARWRPLR